MIISVDDHILEPRTLWQDELPARRARARPRASSRERIKLEFTGGHYGFVRDAPDGDWCDLWLYEDLILPTGLLHAAAGFSREEQRNVAAIYEDFRPGTYDQKARLVDMDENHVEVAINYPNTFPRFAGQGFAERPDKELALACIRIYNDWMIDEWCGGDAKGRLVPLTLVPLWDPALAAAEVRRCAAKGSHAIAFSENPSKLGFASLYSGEWDPLWDACVETATHGVDAHRLVVDDARDQPRRAAGDHDVAQLAERAGLAVRLGVLRHALEVRGPEDRVRREPGRAGCRTCSSGWTSCGTRASASACRSTARRARSSAAGCGAACSTTSTG